MATKRELRREFKVAFNHFNKVRLNLGSADTELRQEASNASMNVRCLMQDLYAINDNDYVCKVFKRYGLT